MGAENAVEVRLTASFQRHLDEIEDFLTQAEAPQAFDAVLDELLDTAIPNLERFPGMGRPLMSRVPGSVEAAQAVQRLRQRLQALVPRHASNAGVRTALAARGSVADLADTGSIGGGQRLATGADDGTPIRHFKRGATLTPPAELREYVLAQHLLLYVHAGDAVYLLAIRHQRQLSFDFEGLWRGPTLDGWNCGDAPCASSRSLSRAAPRACCAGQ